LQDFILEHYSEDGSQYEDSIAEFMDIRQVSSYIRAIGNIGFRILLNMVIQEYNLQLT
jgi:hypothetical protein